MMKCGGRAFGCDISELAVRLARHSAHGWDDAALGDDFSEAANLLNLSLVATRQLVDDIGV